MLAKIEAPEMLVKVALELAYDTEKKNELAKNISQMALHDSAKSIAEEVIKLIQE